MRKFIPALKIALLISIGILVFAIAMNILLGATPAFQLLMPLIGGVFAYWFLSVSNWAAAPKCPNCSTQQPTWRQPTSFRQLLLGGWTCANCGTEIDRRGRAIAAENGNHA